MKRVLKINILKILTYFAALFVYSLNQSFCQLDIFRALFLVNKLPVFLLVYKKKNPKRYFFQILFFLIFFFSLLYFVRIYHKKNSSNQIVHALAIASFFVMIRVSCKNIIELKFLFFIYPITVCSRYI